MFPTSSSYTSSFPNRLFYADTYNFELFPSCLLPLRTVPSGSSASVVCQGSANNNKVACINRSSSNLLTTPRGTTQQYNVAPKYNSSQPLPKPFSGRGGDSMRDNSDKIPSTHPPIRSPTQKCLRDVIDNDDTGTEPNTTTVLLVPQQPPNMVTYNHSSRAIPRSIRAAHPPIALQTRWPARRALLYSHPPLVAQTPHNLRSSRSRLPNRQVRLRLRARPLSANFRGRPRRRGRLQTQLPTGTASDSLDRHTRWHPRTTPTQRRAAV